MKRLPLDERLWSNVRRGADDECWPWLGHCLPKGYGRLKVQRRRILAHRYAWELTRGPIPEGLFVLHRCDNPPCCNPAHLFLGTKGENNTDRSKKGRSGDFAGEKHPSAKLTERDVQELRRLRGGGLTYEELGRRFGISWTHARSVAVRITWRHVA